MPSTRRLLPPTRVGRTAAVAGIILHNEDDWSEALCIQTIESEYPNGDEVVTTLFYERLDKHCTKCLRLDHELKECLVAIAEAKALKAQQIEEPTRMSSSSVQEEASTRQRTVTSTKENRGPNGQGPTNEVFMFSASPMDNHLDRRPYREPKDNSYRMPYKSQTISWNDRSTHRGNPPLYLQTPIPQEAFQEAMGELRNVMIQYTKTADPTESEAQKERMRQAEEHGEMEETAIQMVRASLAPTIGTMHMEQTTLSPERIPASQRLGSPPTEPLLILQDEEDMIRNPLINERIPITMRLGPSPSPTEDVPVNAPKVVKRKPGCPPGAGKNQKKQIPPVDPVSKRRRVPHTKPSPVRRKATKRAENATTAKSKIGPSWGRRPNSLVETGNKSPNTECIA
ncbi:hypothetical protein F2Q69_00061731 [Brassica cretica]|uniref:Zinc knuckle CX2CX4HX4C domain-containing protein n=1 Tax=Brassica cretica TaxID=69181 RepID=A0A8S9RS01_BRACR|nr:hypothetical protein F2Q69_00061731 [Brassica cretica]